MKACLLCLKRRHREIYLNLIDNVKGIRIPTIRENNLHQRIRNAVSAVGRSFEGVVEIDCGILDRGITTEDDKTCNADALMLGLDIPYPRAWATTYKVSVKTLTMPMPLDSRKPARVLYVRTEED